MADVASLRREARRRKILENSQSRFLLIAGKSDETTQQCTYFVYNIKIVTKLFTYVFFVFSAPISTSFIRPEIEESIPDTINCNSSIIPNGALFNESDVSGILSTNFSNTLENNEIINSFSTSLLTNTETTKVTLWEKLVIFKYDIVLVSLTMQILFYLSSVPADITLFFFPILMYIITKLILFPSQHNSKLGSLLMLLSGISQIKIQKFLHIVQLISPFVEDLLIYLFITICSQVMWITIYNTFTS